MHSVLLKPTLRRTLRKGLLIALIGFQASNLIRNGLPEACLERIRLLRNRTELTYNDLRIVWLKMHSVLLKPTIRWILPEGLLIAQIGFQATNLIRNGLPEACFGAHSTSQKSDRN
jgi:hypothetical protein